MILNMEEDNPSKLEKIEFQESNTITKKYKMIKGTKDFKKTKKRRLFQPNVSGKKLLKQLSAPRKPLQKTWSQ